MAHHVGFVLEQTLGHVTHTDNLTRLVPLDPRVIATFGPVQYAVSPGWSRVPGWSNWTVRAGVRAGREIRRMRRLTPDLDALFVHTQVPAVLNRRWLRRVPTVVSLDATPLQYDELGDQYGHRVGGTRSEDVKWRLHRACFARAARIVTWSDWAKADLVERYGVEPERVAVVPPGVITELWAPPEGRVADDEVVRVLFVGGDLARKGGLDLVEAHRVLRAQRQATGRGPELELHLVTTAAVDDEPGIIVHRGLTPNHPALIELYHRADLFCLPTHGDCLPMVLAEAAAAGLPLVSTDVGAIREIVRDGETGVLVPVADPARLAEALGRLVDDAGRRATLGANARRLASRDHDAATNATRLVDQIVEVADGGGAGRSLSRVRLDRGRP